MHRSTSRTNLTATEEPIRSLSNSDSSSGIAVKESKTATPISDADAEDAEFVNVQDTKFQMLTERDIYH